jgi:hypothetical protein
MVLFDFEAPGLAQSWEIQGAGHAERVACLVGSCLHVEAQGRMSMVAGDLPRDWSAVGAIDLRVWSGSDTSVEVVLSGSDGRGGWRHKLDIPADECMEVHLDLGWFRRADGPVVPWQEVSRLSLAFPPGGDVWLDDIESDAGAPSLTAAEIARVTGED